MKHVDRLDVRRNAGTIAAASVVRRRWTVFFPQKKPWINEGFLGSTAPPPKNKVSEFFDKKILFIETHTHKMFNAAHTHTHTHTHTHILIANKEQEQWSLGEIRILTLVTNETFLTDHSEKKLHQIERHENEAVFQDKITRREIWQMKT